MYKFRTINDTTGSSVKTTVSSETLLNNTFPEQNELQRFFGAYQSITSNVVFIFTLGLNALVSKRVSSNARLV